MDFFPINDAVHSRPFSDMLARRALLLFMMSVDDDDDATVEAAPRASAVTTGRCHHIHWCMAARE